MRNSFLIRTVAAALLALATAGCGYHAVAQRGPLAEADAVDVTVFQNKSYRAGVEGVLARDLVDELALRTGGRVLSGPQASLELEGAVLSYTAVPVSYTAADTIKEYRSVIKVQALLREKQTRKVLWKGEVSEDQVFPVNPNIGLQQNAEEAAIRYICRKLAGDIWIKIGEQF